MTRAFRLFAAAAALLVTGVCLRAAEFNVALNGNDANPGTAARPLRTIQRAADLARPGDTITVHSGVYREWVNPPRGGTSDRRRIVYQAAPGELVEITGSDRVTGWTRAGGDAWKVTLPNTYFGRFNPYREVLHGDWFDPRGRVHHPGAVYLDDNGFTEAASLDAVLQPVGTPGRAHPAEAAPVKPAAGAMPAVAPLWFARVGKKTTTIWAQFKGLDPNFEFVEINVRRSVFYPDRPGRNFITVRGFVLCDAATPWAPPTAEQVGLIGTNWSRGWIIEGNHIRNSTCCGISLGKYGDQFDNTSANSAEGYVGTIHRAQAYRIPWDSAHIGHHIVRFNTISHCGQAGIIGSLGGAFSTITANRIRDIAIGQTFGGAEMAGIKLHGAVDVVISHNEIEHCNRGLWLDWMAQGTRVTSNVFYDNAPSEDLLVEVNHGPYLVDNNVFLSAASILDRSDGGAYAHNLVTGAVACEPDATRQTPYLRPHATAIAGLATTGGGDDRFYNNVFVGRPHPAAPDGGKSVGSPALYGLAGYTKAKGPLHTGGNVYLDGARPAAGETAPLVLADDFTWQVVAEAGHLEMEVRLPAGLAKAKTQLVTTRLLGKPRLVAEAYEHPDGSALSLAEDFFGKHRDPLHPTAGPFETGASGIIIFKLW